MQPNKNNTFCWYPFQQLSLKDWDSKKGIVNVAPCCNSIRPGSLDPLQLQNKINESVTANDLFHSKQMQELRHSMLQGKKHSACDTCWQIENRGQGESYRLKSSPAENTNINNPQLQGIDFAFGENCNLRCRMCFPSSSNKLRLDYQYFVNNNIDTKGIYGYEWQENIKPNDFDSNSHQMVYNWKDGVQWKHILDNIHQLNYIKATGGEPILTEGFNQFIDTAIDQGVAKNINIELHSNSTKFTDTLIDKLNQFKSIHLNASIDSVEINYEYVRYPMLWPKLESSVHNILSKISVPFEFEINCVVSLINAHYIVDLQQWQQKLQSMYPNITMSLHTDLLYPQEKYTSVKFLPKYLKQQILQNLKQSQQNSTLKVRYSKIIDYINENMDFSVVPQHKNNIIKELTVFDQSRQQNYRDFLHKNLVEWLESSKQ